MGKKSDNFAEKSKEGTSSSIRASATFSIESESDPIPGQKLDNTYEHNGPQSPPPQVHSMKHLGPLHTYHS